MVKIGFLLVSVFAGLVAPASAQVATTGQQQESDSRIAEAIASGAPAETSGVAVSVIPGVIPLEAYAPGLTDHILRARVLTLQPGGKIGVHAHDNRFVAVYVIEGQIVEHRSDAEQPVIRRAGDSYYEGPSLVHWAENVSEGPARAFAVDIGPGEPK